MVDTCDAFFALPAPGADIRPFGKDDPCYIQYSSGSTTQPRGMLVTQRASHRQCAGDRQVRARPTVRRPGDVLAAALPRHGAGGLLHHADAVADHRRLPGDLELRAASPPLAEADLRIIDRRSPSARPSATNCVSADRRRTAAADSIFPRGAPPASAARWCVPRSWRSSRDLFAESGFDRRAFMPSYGLAEATLAVTFTPLAAAAWASISSNAKRTSGSARAEPVVNGAGADRHRVRAFVACGRPLPGYEVSDLRRRRADAARSHDRPRGGGRPQLA